jgi:cytochrome c biogenesis factor
MLDRLIKFFTSLKLTVALLTLGLVLVFWGTLAQVPMGLYRAQNEFFRSFFVFWQPEGSDTRIPVFPGGYLIGGLLLINLISAHLRYFKASKKKIGIVMIHSGVVLLLVGQLLTDFLATESSMHLRVGGTKNYSEADRRFELAVVDVTEKDADKVFAISQHRLAKMDCR